MKCKGCSEKFKQRHSKDYFCRECYSKRGKKSKNKGYIDEHRFEKFFQKKIDEYKLEYKILRTPRSGGIKEFSVADFFFKFLPKYSVLKNIHIEKKDRKNWNIPKWIKEAEEKEKNMGQNRTPVIVVRKPNSRDEYAITKIEFFIDLLLLIDKLNYYENKEN